MNKSMLLIGLVAAALAAPAGVAEARPDTRKMTCQAAQAFVRQHGAVVMTTGRYTYDRIVSGLGYCGYDEETALKTAPTLDNPRCTVGYICRTRLNDWFRPFHH